MAKIKLYYVKLREQADGSVRPRFEPGPRERYAGFTSQDLRHEDGRWFTIDEARAWSIAKRADIHQQRRSGKKLRPPPVPRGKSFEDLLDAFKNSGRFKRPRSEGGYSDKTKQDYAVRIEQMVWQPQSLADRRAKKPREKEPFVLTAAKDVTPAMLTNDEGTGFLDYLRRVRGARSAVNCQMVASAAYKWQRKARDWQLKIDNPFTKLGTAKPQPGDATIIEVHEFNALVAMGDHPAIAEHELVDSAFLGLFSGQRPDDVIEFDSAGVSDGVIRLVQSKRGKRVEILQLPPFVARLEQMKARREAKGYLCKELIVDSHTGRGFNQNTHQHRMRALIKRTAEGDEKLGLAPCPSIAGKSMRHFRKTLLTWAKRAGAKDNQFAAVSGHSLSSLPQVMPHYYTPGSEEAREAMTLVWQYMQKQGMGA